MQVRKESESAKHVDPNGLIKLLIHDSKQVIQSYGTFLFIALSEPVKQETRGKLNHRHSSKIKCSQTEFK